MTEHRLKVEKKVVDAYKNVEKKFADKFLEEDENGGYNLKTGKMEEKMVDTYKSIEDGVVGAYKKIEDGVVGAYKKIEDKFVDKFLEKKDDEE